MCVCVEEFEKRCVFVCSRVCARACEKVSHLQPSLPKKSLICVNSS